MGFFAFFGGQDAAFAEPALALYRAAVTTARAAPFYAVLGVPDTPDGRFDMIALHVFLALRRLKRDGRARPRALAQALTDRMFADMDRSLRELGVGDLGVGRQVKALAAAFKGRIAAYDAALDGAARAGAGDLAAALGRNIFRAVPDGDAATAAAAIAVYIRAADAALAAQAIDAILSGRVSFPSPPGAKTVE